MVRQRGLAGPVRRQRPRRLRHERQRLGVDGHVRHRRATAFCDAMGGAFDSTQTELECVGERNWTRNAGAANIGIRCCLDL